MQPFDFLEGIVMKTMELITQFCSEDPLFDCSDITMDADNDAYEGFCFKFQNHRYRSRLARKTPKKKGYFVALWQKDELQKNRAISIDDRVDFVIVNVIDARRIGQFIFPVEILHEKGILRSETQPGKMAFRLYTPWCEDLNSHARLTQQWQIPFFINLSEQSD